MTARHYWCSRTPTKPARLGPVPTLEDLAARRIGASASATGRYRDRIDDRHRLNGMTQLAPGVLVFWERAPWRIIEVREVPTDLWSEGYEARFAREVAAWERSGRGARPEKATWPHRPIDIALMPDRQPEAKPLHLEGPASHRWNLWRPDLHDDSAAFHARQECGDAAYRYREQWAVDGADGPQRQLPLGESGEAL